VSLDPARVAEAIADAESDIAMQQAVVSRLDELLDAEQYELVRRERRLAGLRAAIAAQEEA
jgi:uncharacterized protein (UPF0264 family)